MSAEIEKIDENLQMEFIELQCDTLLKHKYKEVGVPEFYEYLTAERFPEIRHFVMRIVITSNLSQVKFNKRI